MALASVMASACCSRDGAAEPGASSRAGASEPGASLVWDVQSDTGGVRILPNLDNALRVAFYNVGLTQSALNANKEKRAQARIDVLVKDVATAFKKHKLHLLLLCELGEHEIGLGGIKNFKMRLAVEAYGLGHGESQQRLKAKRQRRFRACCLACDARLSSASYICRHQVRR